MSKIASVLDNLDLLATFAGGLFAGTAFYISMGETPALRKFGLDEHWRFFPLMFERAAPAQGAMTIIAGLGAIVHGSRVVGAPFYRNLWIASGAAFLAMWPYTLIVLMPVNKTIINDNKRIKEGQTSSVDSGQRKDLLDKWAALHLVRTVTSVVGFGAMVYGLSRHSSLILSF